MKDTHDEKFEHVDKIMPCFFLKAIKIILNSKNSENTTLSVLKNAERDVFWIFGN